MSNPELSRNIGIIGKRAEATDAFSYSLTSKNFNPHVFRTASELAIFPKSDYPEVVIVSEKEDLPEEILEIPRIVIGIGEKGAAQSFLDEGALDYISTSSTSHEDGYVEHPLGDIADYTAHRIDRIYKRTTREPILRRPLEYKGISLDLEKSQLTVDNKKVHLETIQKQMLALMLTERDRIIKKEEFYEFQRATDEARKKPQTLRKHMSSIKAGLRPYEKNIENIRGGGYRFNTDPQTFR